MDTFRRYHLTYSPEYAQNQYENNRKRAVKKIKLDKLGLKRTDLLYPHKPKMIKPTVSDKPRVYDKSIDERPEWINNRSEFGHWEIDTVILTKAKNKVILTLTKRLTRLEIIRLIDGKTSEAVNDGLLKLAQEFEFNTITADNGSGFSRLSEAVPVMSIIPTLMLVGK